MDFSSSSWIRGAMRPDHRTLDQKYGKLSRVDPIMRHIIAMPIHGTANKRLFQAVRIRAIF